LAVKLEELFRLRKFLAPLLVFAAGDRESPAPTLDDILMRNSTAGLVRLEVGPCPAN
jgi:hypothetical protein